LRLKNKVALITGASKGIGKALSIAFAREGANVILAARSKDALEDVEKEISALGGNALVTVCDVTKEEEVKSSIQAGIEKFKQINILVNNAGIGGFRPIYGTHLNNWNRMLEVNLTSTFLCTKHVWKHMISLGSGSIINMSSTSGTRAFPMYASYSSSKWGQIGFTKTAAEEGKPDSIRVNAIAPGKVDTPMRNNVSEDKSKILTAEDCVGVSVFLASDESKYITGQVIEIEWFGAE
jgi:NAD(P)-dependent dehydrogenase (short-subunit alcohol dehydrogenase family)